MKTFLTTILVKIFIKKSKIVAKYKLGSKFSLLSIKLTKEKPWVPGDKVQIKVSETAMRSYTPIDFIDSKTFTTLIYLPLKGPGSNWANKVSKNDKVEIIGPKKSLSLSHEHRYYFFGDETSIGLYLALKKQFNIDDYLFEVNDINECLEIVDFFKMDKTKFIQKNVSFYQENIINRINTLPYLHYILTGNKFNIQKISDQLKLTTEKIILRPYWGKR